MTLIKPWRVASESLSIRQPFTRSPGTRVNILIYPVHSVFYDGGRADAGCEEPRRSRVRGRVQFISRSSQDHEDSITARVCAAGRMRKCQSSNESVHRWFLYCPQRTHTAIHSPSVTLSLTRGARFRFFGGGFWNHQYMCLNRRVIWCHLPRLKPLGSSFETELLKMQKAESVFTETMLWWGVSYNISVGAVQDSALFVTKHKHFLQDILKVLPNTNNT